MFGNSKDKDHEDEAKAQRHSGLVMITDGELARTRKIIEDYRKMHDERVDALLKAFERVSDQLQLLLLETGYEIADVPAHMEIRKRVKGK